MYARTFYEKSPDYIIPGKWYRILEIDPDYLNTHAYNFTISDEGGTSIVCLSVKCAHLQCKGFWEIRNFGELLNKVLE